MKKKIRKQPYPLPRVAGAYFEYDLLSNPYYHELNGNEIRVLQIFYLKRKIMPAKQKQARNVKGIDAIINNGKIQFTYKEAEKKYDIPKSTFQRALNKLKFYGFIKVNIPGGDHCPTKYYIVDDYKKCLDRDYHLGKPIKSGTLIGKKTQFRKHRQK
jgi:hypothetical protein